MNNDEKNENELRKTFQRGFSSGINEAMAQIVKLRGELRFQDENNLQIHILGVLEETLREIYHNWITKP